MPSATGLAGAGGNRSSAENGVHSSWMQGLHCPISGHLTDSPAIHSHFIRGKHIDMPFSAASRGIFSAGDHTEAKEQSSVAPFSQGSTSLGFEPHAITTTGWLRSV